MKGFFARVGETFSRVNQQIHTAIDSVKNTLSQFSSLSYLVLSSDTVREGSFNFFVRFWSGFSMPWHPNVVPALLKSTKTRHALLSSFWYNVLLYGGAAFTYELTKNQINYYFPEMEDSYSEYAVDWCAYAYLINWGVERTLDNLFGYNGAIAAAAYEENPNQGVTTPCSHGRAQQIRGDLTEPIYYLSDIITLKVLMLILHGALPSALLPLAKLLLLFPKAFVNGKCLTEYKFGEGKCTEHRERLFSQNKAHLFGFGMSLALAVEFWNMIIYRFTGVQSVFIDDALTSLIGQGYIFISYTRDQPLPVDEKKYGVNLLKINHRGADEVMKIVGDFVGPRLANPKLRGPLIRFAQQIYALPVTGWALKVILPKKFQTIESIVKMPGINYHINYKREKIEALLEGFQAFRNSYGATLLVYMPTFIVGEKNQNLVNTALRKEWETVIKFIEYALECAEFKPQPNVKWHVAQGNYQKMLLASELPPVLVRQDEVVKYDDEFFEIPCANPAMEEKPLTQTAAPLTPVTPAPDYPEEAALTDMIQLASAEQKQEEVIADYPKLDELGEAIYYSDDEPEEGKVAGITIMDDYQPVNLGTNKSGLFYLQQLKLTSCADGNFQEQPAIRK